MDRVVTFPMGRSYLLRVAQVPVARFPFGKVPAVTNLDAIEIVPGVNDPVSLATMDVAVGRAVWGGPFSSIQAEAFGAFPLQDGNVLDPCQWH